jgi:hypothetical protein
MTKPNRFKKFIYEIASGETEWQYGDGTEMNSDAASFVKYLEALENSCNHNNSAQATKNPDLDNSGRATPDFMRIEK